jgi:RimJ/RimL family protein N-acetyltransferase
MNSVRLVPTAEEYIAGFHALLDVVARERCYIGFVEGPPLEMAQAFVRSIVGGAGVQYLAVTGEHSVVGWCDIVRNPIEGFRHVGRLGMGLSPSHRGRGVGRTLALETIRAARVMGLERIELEVFASNRRAIDLYERLGFVVEGVKRQARRLDDVYDDNILMALIGAPVC